MPTVWSFTQAALNVCVFLPGATSGSVRVRRVSLSTLRGLSVPSATTQKCVSLRPRVMVGARELPQRPRRLGICISKGRRTTSPRPSSTAWLSAAPATSGLGRLRRGASWMLLPKMQSASQGFSHFRHGATATTATRASAFKRLLAIHYSVMTQLAAALIQNVCASPAQATSGSGRAAPAIALMLHRGIRLPVLDTPCVCAQTQQRRRRRCNSLIAALHRRPVWLLAPIPAL